MISTRNNFEAKFEWDWKRAKMILTIFGMHKLLCMDPTIVRVIFGCFNQEHKARGDAATQAVNMKQFTQVSLFFRRYSWEAYLVWLYSEGT